MIMTFLIIFSTNMVCENNRFLNCSEGQTFILDSLNYSIKNEGPRYVLRRFKCQRFKRACHA